MSDGGNTSVSFFKRAIALVGDLLLLIALGMAMFVMVTGGGVFEAAGQTVSVTHTDNPLIAALLLSLMRYLWLGQVPLFWRGAPFGERLDRHGARLMAAMGATSAPGAGPVRSFLVVLVTCTLGLRLLNAWNHPGFVTGDDVELHELTFTALFDKDWPIWQLRNPLYPMVFLYPVQALTARLGASDTGMLVFAARLVVVAIATLTPLLVFAIANRLTASRTIAALACLLFATSRLHFWFGSSELPRPVAAVFVLASFYVLIGGRQLWRGAVAGALLGVGGSLRFGELAFFVPTLAHLALERRLREAVTVATVGTVTAALLLGGSDWLYWGAPFVSLRAIFDYTIVQGQSTRGFQPPLFYLTNAEEWTTIVVLGLSLYSFAGRERRPALWAWMALALLSLLPHKEPRYVIPVQPFVCISAAMGVALLGQRLHERARTVVLLLLAASTLSEVTSWRVHRTDDAVQLARDILQLEPGSIAASHLSRFGGRLYWRDVPRVVPLLEAPLDAAPDVDVMVLLERETTPAERAVLQNAGFRPSGLSEGTEYVVYTRLSMPAP